METTEVEAHMATCSLLLQIINGRLPTGSTNFNHDGTPGKGRAETALMNMNNSVHDFSVKLSPCI